MEHNWFRPFLPLHCKYPSLMYSATSSPLSAKDNHSKQTYEDHLWCKGPRKTIKACHGKGRGTLLLREWLRHSEALTSWESGRAVPFLRRISVVRVYLYIAATTADPAGRDLHQLWVCNMQFILVLLCTNYCTIFHSNNYKPTFAPPIFTFKITIF